MSFRQRVNAENGLPSPVLFHSGCPGRAPVVGEHLCPAILIVHLGCALQAQSFHMHWPRFAIVEVIHVEKTFAWHVVNPRDHVFANFPPVGLIVHA